MIRVVLPYHLQKLAHSAAEVQVPVEGAITMRSVIDAIELNFPTLRGTIRDYATDQRRPFLRFFVCGEDWSLQPLAKELPEQVISGKEPFLIIGAIAGG